LVLAPAFAAALRARVAPLTPFIMGLRRRPTPAPSRWSHWLAGILLALLLLPVSAYPQQPGNVLLDSSEQIFCVLAALNAAGYDKGLVAGSPDSTRLEVRTILDAEKAPVASDLEKFYAEHHVGNDPGADLGQYLSLALLLGSPPDFRLTVPQTDLPPDAKAVAGLVPLLKSFYDQAGLLKLWARFQPRYRASLERYTEDVRKSVVLTDAYFRLSAGGYLGRTYIIYLDLLGAPDQVQARIYGSNYYLVVTPSKERKLNEIRHQYLHFVLDPLAAKYAPEIHQKAELRALAYQAPSLAADFKEDFPLLVTECLIRAAELRMDKRPPAEVEKNIGELTASGLVLVRYFYEGLREFEQQEAAMNLYYKTLILEIDPRAEEKRLASVNFKPAAPAKPQATGPAVSEEQRVLDQGDNLFYRGRYNEAKTAFQTVLEKFNPQSDRALFGMAVAASNTRKPDLAEEYFLKTLQVTRDLRIATWSHIYLGRLYDLKEQRNDALAQYRAASLTASAYPEALRAVQVGLQRPFGSKP
jgi:tetratricopeptide (TPR) repeat protein